ISSQLLRRPQFATSALPKAVTARPVSQRARWVLIPATRLLLCRWCDRRPLHDGRICHLQVADIPTSFHRNGRWRNKEQQRLLVQRLAFVSTQRLQLQAAMTSAHQQYETKILRRALPDRQWKPWSHADR